MALIFGADVQYFHSFVLVLSVVKKNTLALAWLLYSCLGVSCLVLPCLALSCLVLPCHNLSYLSLPCRVVSCLVLFSFVLSCHVLSCLALFCLVLSCLVWHQVYCMFLPNSWSTFPSIVSEVHLSLTDWKQKQMMQSKRPHLMLFWRHKWRNRKFLIWCFFDDINDGIETFSFDVFWRHKWRNRNVLIGYLFWRHNMAQDESARNPISNPKPNPNSYLHPEPKHNPQPNPNP